MNGEDSAWVNHDMLFFFVWWLMPLYRLSPCGNLGRMCLRWCNAIIVQLFPVGKN